MPTPNKFWLALHELMVAYRSEGRTSDERAEAIAKEFGSMSLLARQEVLADLASAAMVMPDLYSEIAPLGTLYDKDEKRQRVTG